LNLLLITTAHNDVESLVRELAAKFKSNAITAHGDQSPRVSICLAINLKKIASAILPKNITLGVIARAVDRFE
jgi:hypothetical protein